MRDHGIIDLNIILASSQESKHIYIYICFLLKQAKWYISMKQFQTLGYWVRLSTFFLLFNSNFVLSQQNLISRERCNTNPNCCIWGLCRLQSSPSVPVITSSLAGLFLDPEKWMFLACLFTHLSERHGICSTCAVKGLWDWKSVHRLSSTNKIKVLWGLLHSNH